jgi:hypothetical protein
MRAYGVLVGKHEGKGTLERLRLRWDDNIKVDVKMDAWTGLIWLRIDSVADSYKYDNESSDSIKFLDISYLTGGLITF